MLDSGRSARIADTLIDQPVIRDAVAEGLATALQQALPPGRSEGAAGRRLLGHLRLGPPLRHDEDRRAPPGRPRGDRRGGRRPDDRPRRRIRAAADVLFLERGYTDVSMDDIAKAAGVARQTVFAAFGSKAGVLKEVLDVRLAGDDAPLSIAERPAAQRMLASTDPGDAIRRQAKIIVDTGARVAPLWPAMREAAATDAEIAELLRFYDEARQPGIGAIVDVVANLGALRRGRSRAKAKDAVFLLTDPSTIYHAQQLGWPPAEIERWYTDCLSALLLN